MNEISQAISDLEQKNMRRQADLAGIKRNYQGKKMPLKVQQMVSNLKKNMARDEDIIEQLKAKKYDTIIRGF